MTETRPSLLTLEEITIAIGDLPLVENVRFSLQQGEILVIVGESGSGKTTLLKACAGMLPGGIHVIHGNMAFAGRPLRQQGDWLAAAGPGHQLCIPGFVVLFLPCAHPLRAIMGRGPRGRHGSQRIRRDRGRPDRGP